MAISIEKFVDISSTFPTTGINARSFGGLVFTASEMLATADTDTKAKYDAGEVVQIASTEITTLFAPGNERDFTEGYYGYMSPTGRMATKLSFAKVMETEFAPAYEKGVAYAVDDYVSANSKNYKCITAVSAADNTGWDAVSSSFEEATGSLPTFYETPGEAFSRVFAKTNMFGSFTFLNGTLHSFTTDDLVTAAKVNGGLDTKFLMVVGDKRGTQTTSEVVAKAQKFKDFNGVCFVSGYTDCSAYMPMAITASTDYGTGVVTTHMFKQFGGEEPTVNGDIEYDAFNAGRVNFYGRTQTNGTTIDFYQRGFNTNGDDTTIYCNEMWFKSACCSALMNMFLANERVPANNEGVAMVEYQVFGVCEVAKNNGSFMPKKVSEAARKAVRTLLLQKGATNEVIDTNLENIEDVGFMIYTYLDQNEETKEYFIHYYVFYGTADSIRFIKGDDVLIK